MTEIKLDSKIGGRASEALDVHAQDLYAKPGARIVAVVELAHIERLEPAPDADKVPQVKMRITAIEIPTREQEGVIRECMRALHLQRTAAGTLDELGDIQLSKESIRLAAGLLTELEVARLRAGLEMAAHEARRIASTTKDLAASELRHELRTVSDGLMRLLDRAALDS